MSTHATTTGAKARGKGGAAGRSKPAREPVPLPPSVMGLLNRRQVCEALGRISPRKLDDLISSDRFPRADKRVGRSPRWSVVLFNRWVDDLTGD